MRLHAHRLDFEWGESIVMAYFADDLAPDFASHIPTWPGSIGILKCGDFNDVQSLIQSGPCDVLLLAAPELKPEELSEVDQLAFLMTNNTEAGTSGRLLLCDIAAMHYHIENVDAVITTQENLVSSLFDLAWTLVTSFTGKGLIGASLADFNCFLGTSKKGMMKTSNHDASDKTYRAMGLSAIEQWPSEAMAGGHLAGLLSSFNIRADDPCIDFFSDDGFLPLMQKQLGLDCPHWVVMALRTERYRSKDMLQLVMLSDKFKCANPNLILRYSDRLKTSSNDLFG